MHRFASVKDTRWNTCWKITWVPFPEGLIACVLSAPSIMSTALTILELNCWVLGDPSDRIFPVEIAANKSVGTLKKCIKEENQRRFQHVDANTLVLWRVSIHDVHNLPENISDVQGVKEGPLSPMDTLSEVFSDAPKKKHIHIIVKPPAIGKCPWYHVSRYCSWQYHHFHCVPFPFPHGICHPSIPSTSLLRRHLYALSTLLKLNCHLLIYRRGSGGTADTDRGERRDTISALENSSCLFLHSGNP